MAVRVEKHGSSWRYIFEAASVDGERKRISKSGFRTKTEASKAGAKAYAEYNTCGIAFTPSSMSFSDLLDMWLKNSVEINSKRVTYDDYLRKVRNHIKPALGNYKISALTTPVLQNFINQKAKEHYSRNTLSVMKGVLSASLGYAVQQGLLQNNPADNAKLPSPRNEQLKLRTAPNHFVEPQTMAKIFERFPKGSSAYIPLMLGYHCGMRLGEVFGLTWDCVDFDKKTISVQKQVQWDEKDKLWYFTKPKYNSIRTITGDEALMTALKESYEAQQKAKEYYGEFYTTLRVDNDKIIEDNSGRGEVVLLVNIRENGTYVQPRTMQHVSSVVHHQLGISDFTFHSLRHTHATMLTEQNAPLKYIMERLGHKNLEVTMKVYQHMTAIIGSQGDSVLNDMFKK